jgi:hypothetical protein
MAPEMMRGLNNFAGKIGVDPIGQDDMDKILWKNTARLWKIDTSKMIARTPKKTTA